MQGQTNACLYENGTSSLISKTQIWITISAIYILQLSVRPVRHAEVFQAVTDSPYSDREIEILQTLEAKVLVHNNVVTAACETCAELDW